MPTFCPSDNRGRRESRVPDAPAASCAKVESTRVSHHRFTGTPGLPCAMVLTAYFVLSPVTGLVCHRRLRIGGEFGPVGPALASAKLDASVGASGPHDFAVRNNIVRLHAVNRSRAQRTALRPRLRADAAASTASRPAFVTIASRPSGDETGRLIEVILASAKAEYFSNQGWTGFADLPDGQFASEVPWPSSVIYLHPQSPAIPRQPASSAIRAASLSNRRR